MDRIWRRRVVAFRVVTVAMTLGSSANHVVAQNTTRVSVATTGSEAHGPTRLARMSSDGRFVAFESDAADLVADDTNGVTDVFVKELATGTIERVSVSDTGSEGDGRSRFPAISADGRFVAFLSEAGNLVTGDTNGVEDVFRFDRVARTILRVSVTNSGGQADRRSDAPDVSGDGRFVVFGSDATNLVPSDTNGTRDVFRRDVTGAATIRVSVDSTGAQVGDGGDAPKISLDGDRIAFESRSDELVSGDLNSQPDVFVREVTSGRTICASVDPTGTPADGGAGSAAISGDGNIVAFVSGSTVLVDDDSNDAVDAFVRVLDPGITERVSVSTHGLQADGRSDDVALSHDGSRVVFASFATTLVLGDTNDAFDVFLRDRSLGFTTRLTLSASNVEGDSFSEEPTLSGDGRLAAFTSAATNLVADDTNGVQDAFVRESAEAARSSYGSGWPGTLGVPAIAAQSVPRIGFTVLIDVGNSRGWWTVGVMLAGLESADVDSGRGGTLLVDPLLVVPVVLAPDGASFALEVPNDDVLAGVAAFFQALEVDPGASRGLSFTPGLELDFGF